MQWKDTQPGNQTELASNRPVSITYSPGSVSKFLNLSELYFPHL